MNLLLELKSVNPKDPGGWPWPVKITALVAIVVAVVLAGAVLDWMEQWDELSAAQLTEEKLKMEFESKKGVAINLDIIKKKLMETKRSFDALLKQLPSKAEMDALLTDINQAGLGRGLQFELFKPGAETITGVFAEQPIALKVTGNYDDLGRFASDIGQLPRIVALTDISIAAAANKGPTGGAASKAPPPEVAPLVMDAQAKTYRYLDEEEIAALKAAQRAAQKAADDKAAAKKGGGAHKK